MTMFSHRRKTFIRFVMFMTFLIFSKTVARNTSVMAVEMWCVFVQSFMGSGMSRTSVCIKRHIAGNLYLFNVCERFQ